MPISWQQHRIFPFKSLQLQKKKVICPISSSTKESQIIVRAYPLPAVYVRVCRHPWPPLAGLVGLGSWRPNHQTALRNKDLRPGWMAGCQLCTSVELWYDSWVCVSKCNWESYLRNIDVHSVKNNLIILAINCTWLDFFLFFIIPYTPGAISQGRQFV